MLWGGKDESFSAFCIFRTATSVMLARASIADAGMYTAANAAINRAVFDGRHKLAPVYLDMDDAAAIEVAATLGVPDAGCLQHISKAVAASLTWKGQDPFSWHLAELEAWNELERFDAPPFTALLAVLSLAAERMREDDEFTSQNYYVRLFEVLGVESDSQKNSLRQNAKSTKRFWDALNGWLAENDFEYGRPTAKPVNSWPYVSFALSQALLREGDRKRIHNLFAEYGLAPHEKLTDAEMSLYLHEWMRGPSPSAWLKRIWNAPDLRPRVAAAACAELEAWEGAGPSGGAGGNRRRLSWAASLQTFPRAQLRMFMSAAGGGDEEQITLRLEEDAAPAATAAFEGCGSGIWLTPLSGGELSVVEPVRDIALSPLMLASFELQDDTGGLRFQRAARAIVPMVKLDTGAFYREVSRISFLRPHLVLCHEKWADRVIAVLNANARQGFVRWTPEKLPGLPRDWFLFSGVEMLKLPQLANENMQPLVPLAEGVSVEMIGGLRLSQNLWHALAPPEITASAPSGPLALTLHDAAGVPTVGNQTRGSSCRLTLESENSSAATNYTLRATVDGKARSEIHLSFRSASHPRRIADAGPAYQLAAAGRPGMLTASADACEGLPVRGMTLHGQLHNAASYAPAALAGMGPAAEAEEETPTELEGDYHLHGVSGLQETCVLRGTHTWICDAFEAGDDRSADRWMACSFCNNRVLTRNRGRITRRTRGPHGANRPAGQTKPPAMRARDDQAPDPDLIFDALAYLGSGTWRKLQDLVSSGSKSSIAVQRMCSALAALGHIDVSFDDRLRSPLSWTVAPPALVFTPGGSAFLAGFRNAELILKVSAALSAIGAHLEVQEQEDAPSSFIWSRLTPDTARNALREIHDVHGRKIAVTTGFTGAIAANAPATSQLQKFMPAIHLANPKDLQRFDPGTGAWRAAAELDSEGAYRGDFAGRRYIYRDASGAQREGSFALVKLLAAKAAGMQLHGYDASSRIFKAVLGCEPPGLWPRALAANSGRVPTRVGSQLHYHGVLPGDASLILSKLYS